MWRSHLGCKTRQQLLLSTQQRSCSNSAQTYDVAIIGGGIAGMATAARLQRHGVSRTVVLDQHSTIGGCCGFWEPSSPIINNTRFNFDVGATTLVDFEAGGVGGELLEDMGMSPLTDADADFLPGYQLWLPQEPSGESPVVTLHRDLPRFQQERLKVFGDSTEMRKFWEMMDSIASVFWNASRQGIKLPMQSFSDLVNAARKLLSSSASLGRDNLRNDELGNYSLNASKLEKLFMTRYIFWSVEDALKHCRVDGNLRLRGFLRCLVEDTVNCRKLSEAPLINAALGISIRAAGISRHKGGYKGFWERFVQHYLEELGGEIMLNTSVSKAEESPDGKSYILHLRRKNEKGIWKAQTIQSRRLVSAIPVENTIKLLTKSWYQNSLHL